MKRKLAFATAVALTMAITALTLPAAAYTPTAHAATMAVAPVAAGDQARGHVAIAVRTSWTVQPGQSLSVIAASAYGSSALWASLWWINKATVRNPNVISVGQVLKLSAWHPQLAWLDRAALHAIPVPAPAPRAVTTVTSAGHVSYHRSYRRSYSSGTYNGSGGMESCIIARESGGNSQVVNSSGHYGLYQFSASTWVASGGSSSTFGHASVAEQKQVFRNAVAARGYSDWTPYDGC